MNTTTQNTTTAAAKMNDAAELEQALKRLPEAERVALLYMIKGVELAIETAANRAS